MGQAIHVALTFDDRFWAPAYATMRGLCMHTKRRADVVFHLCVAGLSPAHRAVLTAITTEFGAQLCFYDLDAHRGFQELVGRARYNTRLSNIVYARLMFSALLPATIDRLIYLDCDVLVRAPIERLAEIDLQGHALGAVQDWMALTITKGRDCRQNHDLFDWAEPYFNAGVLTIDMRRWCAADVPGRLEAAIADGTLDRIYYDQDFLNLTFRGDWLPLDQRWNLIDPRPAHQGLNPFLLHYTGNRKPWHIVSRVAFARIYRHVMTNAVFYRYWRERMQRRLGIKHSAHRSARQEITVAD